MAKVSAKKLYEALQPYTGPLNKEKEEGLRKICKQYNCRPDFAYFGGRGNPDDEPTLRGVRFPTTIYEIYNEPKGWRPGTVYACPAIADDFKNFIRESILQPPNWYDLLLDYEWEVVAK